MLLVLIKYVTAQSLVMHVRSVKLVKLTAKKNWLSVSKKKQLGIKIVLLSFYGRLDIYIPQIKIKLFNSKFIWGDRLLKIQY